MPSYESYFHVLGLIVAGAPVALMCFLGMASIIGRTPSEDVIAKVVQSVVVVGLLSAVAVLGLMLATGIRSAPIEIGSWVMVPSYHFELKLLFDRLSVPFVILSFLLCGTVSAFANRYLHREAGFNRFFVCFSFFLVGIVLTSLAGTIETLFAGWELVGLSSALLVAFFHERQLPVANGLRVWTVYRFSDAALMTAAIITHHLSGNGDFTLMFGHGPWPDGHVLLSSNQALIVGLLLLIAAAGKSALIPFSGWLPRAMEGPTPSSAIFYGALSVHLGAYLLLRASPLLEASTLLCIAVVALGLATAIYASVTSHVQTDIKSALAFASLAQVGLIVAEIGVGLRYVALVHILGHACLRTLQFLRAPTLLHDYHMLENAIGDHLPQRSVGWDQWLRPESRRRLYRFALERGRFDALLSRYMVQPVWRLFESCERLERRWTDWLSGEASRESQQVKSTAGALEDLA